MVFSSLEFLFWFLPAFLLLYYIASDRYKNYVLLFASLFFYAYGEPLYLLLMIFSIVVNYSLSHVMINKDTGEASKLILTMSLVIDFGILFVFKYFNFFVSNINNCFGYTFIPLLNLTLPLGISFYTFQILSYELIPWDLTELMQELRGLVHGDFLCSSILTFWVIL